MERKTKFIIGFILLGMVVISGIYVMAQSQSQPIPATDINVLRAQFATSVTYPNLTPEQKLSVFREMFLLKASG